jgi:hypothetical protein
VKVPVNSFSDVGLGQQRIETSMLKIEEKKARPRMGGLQEDFFKPAYLPYQVNSEPKRTRLRSRRVYTFGPTFPGREFANLASFAWVTCWNQMAFADLETADNAEQMLKFVVARLGEFGGGFILSRLRQGTQSDWKSWCNTLSASRTVRPVAILQRIAKDPSNGNSQVEFGTGQQ